MSGWRVASDVRQLPGYCFAGGSAFGLVRLSPRGAQDVIALLGTQLSPAPGTPTAALCDALVRRGILIAPTPATVGSLDVTVVIPARSDTASVMRILDSVPDECQWS
jgi:hypothetical protein